MQRARSLVAHFAKSPAAPMLITGEIGTGKARVAKAIHDASARAAQPFMRVACAHQTEDELDCALFGRASDALRGVFDEGGAADVFLEDVDRLSPALQGRLVRIIETRTVARADGTEDVATEARVIASSSVDLERTVQSGGFRADLFRRLSVLRIELPPLRVRPDDVPVLVGHFAERFGREFRQPVPDLTSAVLDSLKAHAWPGNVRELRNLVERAMLGRVANGEPADLSAWLPGHPRTAVERSFMLPTEGISLEAVERSLVVQALARTAGNQTRAAALLSLNRDQIRYRIEKFGLRAVSAAGTSGQSDAGGS